MNISLNRAAQIAWGQLNLGLKRHAPDILLGVGIAGGIGASVLACKASTNLPEVNKAANEKLEAIREEKDHVDAKVYGSSLTRAYVDVFTMYAKLYGPAIALGGASIGCILASHGMMKSRQASLVSAYTTLDQGFKAYRKRVVEEQGAEADKRFLHGIHKEEIEEETVDEATGEVKKEKKTVNVMGDNPNEYSPYARFFDEASRNWEKDAESNYNFVKLAQFSANNKLMEDGYLLLNDVYQMLDIPQTKAGATVGWIYDPKDPNRNNCVDFGITEVRRKAVREFVNGYERSILLDFNVDGPILEYLPDDPFDHTTLRGADCHRIHFLKDLRRG